MRTTSLKQTLHTRSRILFCFSVPRSVLAFFLLWKIDIFPASLPHFPLPPPVLFFANGGGLASFCSASLVPFFFSLFSLSSSQLLFPIQRWHALPPLFLQLISLESSQPRLHPHRPLPQLLSLSLRRRPVHRREACLARRMLRRELWIGRQR